MKLISWNVNGLRSCMAKGFCDFFKYADADFFCVQEIKMFESQAENFETPGYFKFWNSAERAGYSGTLTLTKHEPMSVTYGIEGKHTDEGRVITLEYPKFYMVNCYAPNSKDGLLRIDYRCAFEDDMRAYLSKLSEKKAVIYCGDLNVAHEEIDLKNPKANIGSAGFSYEERGKMDELLAAGFCDTFRYLNPDLSDAYTWWSYRAGARKRNVGWRIDYFIVSDYVKERISDAHIYSSVLGSDHCPIELQIEM
ncbi:MAG: exodeoxyribonuclease III [Clostridia bacterium]|nr:exodeoxyribonuclease III [Clostridia bacterium]